MPHQVSKLVLIQQFPTTAILHFATTEVFSKSGEVFASQRMAYQEAFCIFTLLLIFHIVCLFPQSIVDPSPSLACVHISTPY